MSKRSRPLCVQPIRRKYVHLIFIFLRLHFCHPLAHRSAAASLSLHLWQKVGPESESSLFSAECLGYLTKDQMRLVVLEMYELDMKVDERVPNYLLRQIDSLFMIRKARSQAPYITIEQFAAFSLKFPEFMIHAYNLQHEVPSTSAPAHSGSRSSRYHSGSRSSRYIRNYRCDIITLVLMISMCKMMKSTYMVYYHEQAAVLFSC